MPILLELMDLRVRSLDVDFHEISWKVKDTSEDLFDYTLQVLRSESPSGPFDVISVPFQDRYVFVDNMLQQAHRWRKFFYLVRVTQVRTGDTQDFGPVANDPDPDRITLELRSHMQLLYKEFAGRPTWALPVRTFGQRCECWNATLKKRTRSGCSLCFDTGFVRGYMSPIEIWGQIDPSPKTEQNMQQGTVQQSNTTGRFGYFPPLKPRDLVIEPENRRWRVTKVTFIEHLRAPITQEIEAHEIPSTDVEYAIPLNLDEALKDLWTFPARNATQPTNLENFRDGEYPDPFRIYNYYPPRGR